METNISDGVGGWRGTLGYINPSVYSTADALDFHSFIPEGVRQFIVTLGIGVHTDQEFQNALSKLDEAARCLATHDPDFVSVHGTPLVVSKGFGFDREIIKRVEAIVKVPATTDLTATVDALHVLNLKNIVMASPLPYELDAKIKKFLEDSGFNIIHVKSLNIKLNKDIRNLPRNAAYAVAKQAFLEAPRAEGIYIPCGGWCPAWVIDCLERDLRVPVVHGTKCAFWAGLKALGIKEPIKGVGRLFETLAS
ncbi:MAG: hypothetical protein HY673_15395 [Chloroflexi bacterium]|nr:hypothetical protein [Chloroflexota bacterium]